MTTADWVAHQSATIAFDTVFREHYHSVFRLALSMAGNPVDAEDISQETFIAVLRSLPTFRGQSAVGTWIYRIAIRTATRWLARRPPDGETDVEPIADSQVLPIDLLRALRRLTVNDRMVVSLVGVEGLSHREASTVLGVPEGTVASRMHHARQRLRAQLSDE